MSQRGKPHRLREFVGIAALALGAASAGAKDGDVETGASEPREVASKPSEAITSSKDQVDVSDGTTVAEALSKRSDLSFNNVRVDGAGAAGGLDDIPSEMVERIEVLKAVTPDMDADARGGSLRLKTKPSFLLEKTYSQSQVRARYRDVIDNTEMLYKFFVNGPVSVGGDLGYRFGVSYEDDYEGLDNVSADWERETIAGQEQWAPSRQKVDVDRKEGSTFSIQGGLDWKLNDRFYLTTNGSYSDYQAREKSFRISHEFEDGAYRNVGLLSGEVAGASIKRYGEGSEIDETEREFSASGHFQSGDFEAELIWSMEEETDDEFDDGRIDFIQSNVDMSYAIGEDNLIDVTYGANEAPHDTALYIFEDLKIDQSSVPESFDRLELNMRYDLKLSKLASFAKFGYKTRSRTIENINRDRVYDAYAGELPLGGLLASFDERGLIDGRYALFYVPDSFQAIEHFDANESLFTENVLRSREQADTNSYYADETVDAVYLMINSEWRKLRLLAGWRREETTIEFRGNELLIDEAGEYLQTNAVSGTNNYRTNLPGAHFGYQFSPKLVVIGSWTKTVKRPEIRSVVPFRRVNREERELDEGNPDLGPTLYTNYDLSIDWDYTDESRISLELFQKDIEGFVFESNTVLESGIYAGYERERPENSGKGTQRGVKLLWNQNLSELGSFLEGLNLNVSYKWTESEALYLDREDKDLRIVGIPDYDINATLRYRKSAFDFLFTASYEGERLNGVADDSAEDHTARSRLKLDFQSSYDVSDRVTIDFNWSRLGGNPNVHRYEGDPIRSGLYRLSDQSISLSLRYQL